jgi:CDP-glycerol glycerophosphotransferase (TagB/SpsB family)
MSTHDTGRYMADVSHSLNIPSVHVDYALFSDNPLMDRGIKYSTRLPISPAITSIWKKQNDPTPNHIPIGFLKFDKIPISGIIKRDFFEENKLNINEPTLFFASTWSEAGTSYESEKRQIIENLVTLCKHKNWNLIIKKHPLEFDTIADTIINEKGNSKQVVFNHASLSLFDAITFSDITINQMSSVVLECLYLNKPFCYISLSTEKKMFENSIFREENFAKKFSSLNELNDFLSSFFSNVSIQNSIKKEMENKKEYYLTKTDGLASQRLLNLLVLMAEENKKLNLQPQEDLYQLKT